MSDQNGDWVTCDGRGGRGPVSGRPSRRGLIAGGVAAALAAWAGRSALAQISVGAGKDEESKGDVLVTLFLRGGVDGLSAVVPYGDDDYYRARPTLGLAGPPRAGSGARNAGAVTNLDGFFGLSPALAALYPLYQEGHLAAIQAIGSQDQTRSHFEAMATMERGLADDRATTASGWLARYLAASPPPGEHASPLRAVALGNVLPDSLRGATDVSVLSSVDDLRLNLPTASAPRLHAGIAALYGTGHDAVSEAGRGTLAVLETLRRVDPSHYRPENGAAYPKSDLGNGLRQIACLIKARVSLEVACLDRGGWDTHVGQGGAIGWLSTQLKDVGDALAAFARDLGVGHLARVTLVVMTEFGRRVAENSGLGTDHGRGSVMFVLGGNVNGGKVYGAWPGLGPDKLEDPGDLRVTTDYRNVLAEIITRRCRSGASTLPTVFPGKAVDAARFPGIVRPLS